MPKTKAKLITVCSACLRASSWQGVHYCDKASNSATLELPRSQLIALRREHPSFWRSWCTMSEHSKALRRQRQRHRKLQQRRHVRRELKRRRWVCLPKRSTARAGHRL